MCVSKELCQPIFPIKFYGKFALSPVSKPQNVPSMPIRCLSDLSHCSDAAYRSSEEDDGCHLPCGRPIHMPKHGKDPLTVNVEQIYMS